MRARREANRRLASLLVLAGAIALLWASQAEGATSVGYQSGFRFDPFIGIEGDDGAQEIAISFSDAPSGVEITIADPSGVRLEFGSCRQPSPTAVTCPGASEIFVDLYGGADRFQVEPSDDQVPWSYLSAEGGAGADVISTGGGDDRIEGGGGDDELLGGDGEDQVFAGSGRDLAVGGTGDDALLGGSGADLLQGVRGEDRISGGNGNDRLEGGPDDDLIYPALGRDRISGGSGSDRLHAEDGRRDRRLACGPGADSVYLDRSERNRRQRCESFAVVFGEPRLPPDVREELFEGVSPPGG